MKQLVSLFDKKISDLKEMKDLIRFSIKKIQDDKCWFSSGLLNDAEGLSTGT